MLVQTIDSFFNDRRMRKTWIKLRVVVIIALFIPLAYFATATYFWYAFGVSLLGELVQVWCFASLDKKKTLSVRGPYCLVRNPMYIGRLALVMGYLMLLDYWWYSIPAGIVFYYFYMRNRVKREEETLKGIFGEPYLQYCENVGRFVPELRELSLQDLLFFRMRLLRQNNGLRNLIAFLISYIALYAAIFRVWG